MTREWHTYPSRFFEELNLSNGVLGAIGFGLATAGGVAVGFQGVLTWIGVFVLTVLVLIALVRAYPPPVLLASKLNNQTISAIDLSKIRPPIRSLAVVGCSMVGKTTLRDRLIHRERTGSRTQSVTATIIGLSGFPLYHLAILDGGGEQYTQQFQIAGMSDYLIVVIDHNAHSDIATIDNQRIKEHETFLCQVRRHLENIVPSPKKKWIKLLVNKKDCWMRASESRRNIFLEFCNDELQRWKDSRFAESVVMANHSNESPDDIAQLITELKEVSK